MLLLLLLIILLLPSCQTNTIALCSPASSISPSRRGYICGAARQVFWRARLVAAGQLADFLAPDNPADLPPNWGLVGAASYAAVWGAVTAAGLADWTEVGGLEALYDASRASFAPGPMLAAIKALGADERAAVVSLLEDALNKRKAEANTFFGGKMNRERAVGWLLVRATRGAAQAYVAGLPNESGALRSTDVKMLRTLLPPGGGFGALSGGDVSAKDAIIDGERPLPPGLARAQPKRGTCRRCCSRLSPKHARSRPCAHTLAHPFAPPPLHHTHLLKQRIQASACARCPCTTTSATTASSSAAAASPRTARARA